MSHVIQNEYKGMSTDTLIEELERLNLRVRDRDSRMYKRLKNPMGHAHPCQFWPICADAHKTGPLNAVMYWRPMDYVGAVSWGSAAYLAGRVRRRLYNPLNFRWTRGYNAMNMMTPAFFLYGVFRCNSSVTARMWGLEENAIEIEKYGALYPSEIKDAAERKHKFEQEYIRVKEGLANWGRIAEHIDAPSTYWESGPAKGISGHGGYIAVCSIF